MSATVEGGEAFPDELRITSSDEGGVLFWCCQFPSSLESDRSITFKGTNMPRNVRTRDRSNLKSGTEVLWCKRMADSVRPLAAASAAQAHMEPGEQFGTLVRAI